MHQATQRAEADETAPAIIVAEAGMKLSLVMDPDVRRARQASKQESQAMAEPASTTGGIAVAIKAFGGLAAVGAAIATAAAFLATVVVMCMTRPRSGPEWATGIISTVVSSLAGGAYVVGKLGLHRDLPADDTGLFLVLVVIGGVIFSCGLPGWFLVRCTFNWFEKRKTATLPEVIQEGRSVLPL